MSQENPQKVIIHISTASIFKVIGILLLLGFLYLILDILVILLVSLLLAAALNPAVNAMHKRRIPRPLGVAIIYLILFTVFFGIIALIIPPLVFEVQQISQNFPALWERFIQTISGRGGFEFEEELKNAIHRSLGSLQESLSSQASNTLSFIRSIFGNVISFILTFVLTFYLLVQEDAIKKAFRNFTPKKYKPYLNTLITRMQDRIGAWLRGEIILVAVIGLLSIIGLRILGIKYFLVLGLFAGLLELVPYVGPLISAIPAVFIASSESLWKGVAVIILFWLIQQMENHLIVPKVMQKVIGLNPIIVIIVILIGARLRGLIGVLIAVPIAAALSVLVKDIFEKGMSEEETLEETEDQTINQ